MTGVRRSAGASPPSGPSAGPKDVVPTDPGAAGPGSASAAGDARRGSDGGRRALREDGPPPPASPSGDSRPSAAPGRFGGNPGPAASAEEGPAEADGLGRIWTVLIAALGGEGGGVLSGWLVDAASGDGRKVQATSVPGVAQRTGATTYYLEIGPREGGAPRQDPNPDPGPDMALLPTPGNVDLLVASELLEAGRAAQNGMITPDRTTVIASTHRMFAIAEKSAMGDGRFDDARVRRAVRELSRRHVLTDLGKVAQRAGTVLSSVLLGAIAGSGALPIPSGRLRAAIERAGIAVEANLRGFDAGAKLFDDAQDPEPVRPPPPPRAGEGADSLPAPGSGGSGRVPASLASRVDTLPASVREFARIGVERTVDYQDERYGAAFLDRIGRLLTRIEPARAPRTNADPAAAPRGAGSAPGSGSGGGGDGVAGDLHAGVRETARQLALWMCFEDIIRVADLKTRRSRIERVRAEVRAQPGQPVAITEFLKPGVDEWCSLLPSWLARRILRAADRGGWRRRLNVGLHVRTSSVAGFLLLWALARLRGIRRGTYRFREEQARIETWLDRVAWAHTTSPAFALEAAKCANLVKGYGDTHERGVRSFERTMACLDACAAAPDPAASLRTLREAALADPEGRALEAAVAALQSGPAEEIRPSRAGDRPGGRDTP